MFLQAMDEVISDLTTNLNCAFGHCSVLNGQEFAQLTTATDDFEIKITIELKQIEK